MATRRKTRPANGDGTLEDAIRDLTRAQASLTQAQAATTTTQAAFLERLAKMDETQAAIIAILNEHSRILAGLPDAIREKVGFRAEAAPGKQS